MKIRLARPEDGASAAEIYAPIVRETAISFEVIPPSGEEMATRIVAANRRHAWLVAEDAGTVAGYVYASGHKAPASYDWSANTSVYLRDGARGKGLGRALYCALLNVLKAQNYRMAFAGIALPNAASTALHEAVGFTHLGTYVRAGFKLGRWHNVGWWQLPLAEGTDPPLPIRPLTGLGDVQTLLRHKL